MVLLTENGAGTRISWIRDVSETESSFAIALLLLPFDLELSLLDKFSLRAKDDGLQSVLLTKGLAAKIKVWASSSSTFTAKQRWGRRTMVLVVKIRNILTNFMSVFTRLSQGARLAAPFGHLGSLWHVISLFSSMICQEKNLVTCPETPTPPTGGHGDGALLHAGG